MRSARFSIFIHVPLALVAMSMLLPLVFMFNTALSTPEKAFEASSSVTELLIPQSWRWENFREVWEVIPFLRYYINSLCVAVVVTFGQVLTSACAAYAFARLQWPGRDKVFVLYLATMMLPSAVTMIPNFAGLRLLPDLMQAVLPMVDWSSIRHLTSDPDSPVVGRLIGLDSYFALTIPVMFSAYGTFLLRQFFLTLPRELEEAAKIDGCGHWRIFTTVTLPLSLPSLATLTVFTFMGIWGAFLWPLVTTNIEALRTLPVALQAFQGQYGAEWHLMMAAALLILVPVLVIFLAAQRFFVSGLTLGGVKG